MKTGLDHLPYHKREQLRAISAFIQQSLDVEMIILFGSHARGDWVEDLPNGYFSDYDLLVIVATEDAAEDDALWHRISKKVRPMAGRTPVSLFVHDSKFVAEQVRIGQFFFSDIVNEGIVLHDSGRFVMPRARTLNALERLQIAEQSFRYWFNSANDFVRGASYFMSGGVRSHAAFMLHQAAERYFDAALLAYTGYKPKTHDLEELADKTAPLHLALAGALPRTDAEDEHLFSLLRRAYVEARYSKDYQVTDDELVKMRERVLDLAHRSLEASGERLAKIIGPNTVGPLPTVPTTDETMTMPPLPSSPDPKALEAWREEVVRLSYERGLREGEAKGEARGEAKGREEGLREGEAKAILAVLRGRGIAVSDVEAARILACRDQALLAQLWSRVLSVQSAAALWT
jgi:HEPN domain-containing protein/predicted nucleotidyltransferase